MKSQGSLNGEEEDGVLNISVDQVKRGSKGGAKGEPKAKGIRDTRKCNSVELLQREGGATQQQSMLYKKNRRTTQNNTG